MKRPHDLPMEAGTLGDFFVAAALSGMMSGGWVPGDEKKCAARLYDISEAILAERAKRTTNPEEKPCH